MWSKDLLQCDARLHVMWRCRASGCILVLNVAMHYNGSDRMHWFQGSASAVLMCGCSNPSPVCSMTAWLHDCLTVWLHDCCREIWRMLLATNHCTHCGGYAVVVAHTGDSSQNLCGDHSPLTLARGAQTNGGHHFSCYVKNYFFVINVVDIEWSFFSFFSVQLFPENRQWWLRLRTADWHRYRTRIMHSQY